LSRGVHSAIALLILVAGCFLGNAQATVRTLPVLEDSIPRWGRIAISPQQVIENALIRLSSQDTLGLWQMMPDPDLKTEIYLETPEGQQANEIQINFLKEFYYLDNQKLLLRRLGRDGGKHLKLVSWKSNSPPVLLKEGGRILRDIEILVREKPDAPVRRLFFVQSIYAGPKGCKIWGFQDEKAQAKTRD
jgi:hypothetical protein